MEKNLWSGETHFLLEFLCLSYFFLWAPVFQHGASLVKVISQGILLLACMNMSLNCTKGIEKQTTYSEVKHPAQQLELSLQIQ